MDRIRYHTRLFTLALMELLIVPKRQEGRRLQRKYRALLTTFLSEPLIPMNTDVADLAAEIRACHRFKTLDAIQLASAVIHGYEVIYTNDQRFERFPDLDIVFLDTEIDRRP